MVVESVGGILDKYRRSIGVRRARPCHSPHRAREPWVKRIMDDHQQCTLSVNGLQSLVRGVAESLIILPFKFIQWVITVEKRFLFVEFCRKIKPIGAMPQTSPFSNCLLQYGVT